jgi:hypothetical protein
VVKQTSHRYSLFLTSRKHVVPVVDRIETLLSLFDVVELDPFQKISNFIVCTGYAVFGVGVDDLISESARGQVGALRDIEKFVHVGSVENTSSQGP